MLQTLSPHASAALEDLATYHDPHRRAEVLIRAIEAFRPLAERIVSEGIAADDWFAEACRFAGFDQGELWEGSVDAQVASTTIAADYVLALGIAVGLQLTRHQLPAAMVGNRLPR